MPKERGVAMYMVLVTLLIVVVLANVVLTIMSSQSRLTHHQVSRIQAYYASQAGMVLALENLRIGEAGGGWPLPLPDTYYTRVVCRDATLPGCTGAIIDDDLPISIQNITIFIVAPGTAQTPGVPGSGCLNPPAGINACINVTADYTYTSP
jgi:hypothetical protein